MDFSTVMRTRTLDDIKQFLDERYPDVGMDCPLFPIMVVLFSAAIYGTANVGWICQFTGYRRAYVNAIATNMVHNGLWQGDRYKASECLQDMGLDPLEGYDDEFWLQVEIASGRVSNPGVSCQGKPDTIMIVPYSSEIN
jgi:hypothetical protein